MTKPVDALWTRVICKQPRRYIGWPTIVRTRAGEFEPLVTVAWVTGTPILSISACRADDLPMSADVPGNRLQQLTQSV